MRFAATIGTAALLSLCLVRPFPAVAGETRVKVVRLAGDVLIYPGHGEEFHQAELNETLTPGDFVRTLDDSRTVLRFPNGALILINEHTDLYLSHCEEHGKTLLEVYCGEFIANIQRALSPGSSVEVSVPNCYAVVRGTVFGARVLDSGEVEFYGHRGLVHVYADSKTYQLRPGRIIRLARNRPAQFLRHKLKLKQVLQEFEFAYHPPRGNVIHKLRARGL